MRLTKKYKEDYFVNPDNKELIKLDVDNDHNSSQIIRNKLGQLEDIEEELGIDLITLFEALKFPIYTKESDEAIWCSNRLMYFLKYFALVIGEDTVLYLKDYGKTWALTKEELK